MTDIVICMNDQDLEHKQKDGFTKDGRECFWSFGRMPKNVKDGDKLFVVAKRSSFGVEGWHVTGYFVIESVNTKDSEVSFRSGSWSGLYPPQCFDANKKPLQHFRGFRYRWW